jgi:hypothetical protein
LALLIRTSWIWVSSCGSGQERSETNAYENVTLSPFMGVTGVIWDMMSALYWEGCIADGEAYKLDSMQEQ